MLKSHHVTEIPVFHGAALIITAINKLLNLPLSTAGQSSPLDRPAPALLPVHQSEFTVHVISFLVDVWSLACV